MNLLSVRNLQEVTGFFRILSTLLPDSNLGHKLGSLLSALSSAVHLVPLSKYNAASGTLSEEELAKGKGAPPRYATSAEQLKPYANTLGLFAIRNAEPENLEAARTAILRAAAKKPPAFD